MLHNAPRGARNHGFKRKTFNLQSFKRQTRNLRPSTCCFSIARQIPYYFYMFFGPCRGPSSLVGYKNRMSKHHTKARFRTNCWLLFPRSLSVFYAFFPHNEQSPERPKSHQSSRQPPKNEGGKQHKSTERCFSFMLILLFMCFIFPILHVLFIFHYFRFFSFVMVCLLFFFRVCCFPFFLTKKLNV